MIRTIFISFLFVWLVFFNACKYGPDAQINEQSTPLSTADPIKPEKKTTIPSTPIDDPDHKSKTKEIKTEIEEVKSLERQEPSSASKPTKPKVRRQADITFEKTTYDFGEIEEGDKIKYSFNFKNTGTGPLTIDDVSVSCGCTVPSYPIMPIDPGESGSIGVVFDSKGKFGSQRPFITVKSNTKEKLTKLFLTGSIKHVFENATPKDSSKISENSNS